MSESVAFTCGHCYVSVRADVAIGRGLAGHCALLICPNCNEGSVRLTDGSVLPHPRAVRPISQLPPDVDQAWIEACSAFGVAAWTAAEMMCRKILMHIAVDVANSKQGTSFVTYLNDLESTGYIAPALRSKISGIKDRGNSANHELNASSSADAGTTLAVTEHLLRTVYEVPNL